MFCVRGAVCGDVLVMYFYFGRWRLSLVSAACQSYDTAQPGQPVLSGEGAGAGSEGAVSGEFTMCVRVHSCVYMCVCECIHVCACMSWRHLQCLSCRQCP